MRTLRTRKTATLHPETVKVGTDGANPKKSKLQKGQIKETNKEVKSETNVANIASSSVSRLTSPYFNNNKRLLKEFYQKESIELSQDLLGKVLARRLPNGEILRGTIVETEAYPGTNVDPASHSYRGKITERTKAMFMEPGTAYVYIIHGIYNCFNISAQAEGSVCLIRAVEPLEDSVETMLNFRQQFKKRKADKDDSQGETSATAAKDKRKLTNETKPLKTFELGKGPGKLCICMDIKRDSCDKLDLVISDDLWLEENNDPQYNQKGSFEIEIAKRVGLESTPVDARNKLWRYFIKNNYSVSTARPSLIKKALKG